MPGGKSEKLVGKNLGYSERELLTIVQKPHSGRGQRQRSGRTQDLWVTGEQSSPIINANIRTDSPAGWNSQPDGISNGLLNDHNTS